MALRPPFIYDARLVVNVQGENMAMPYSDDNNRTFLQCFGAATLCSRRGSLAEQATLLRFQPGTRGFHRRYDELVQRRAVLQKSLRSQVQKHLHDCKGLTIAIFDDSPIRKMGDKFEGQAWHFDHSMGNYYHGFTACSTAIYRGGKFGVLQTQCSTEHTTKIALLNDAVASLCQEPLAPDVFLFDAWYALAPVLHAIELHKKIYITKLKSNMIACFDDEKMSLRALAKGIEHVQYEHIVVHERSFWVLDLELSLKTLGTQRVLVCKDDVFAEPIFLTTNSRTFSTKFVLILYQKRFKIEVFFKDAKQYLNLSTFQCRSREKWELHFVLLQILHWSIQRRNSISKTVRKIWNSVESATLYINKNDLFQKIIDDFSTRCQT